MLQAWKQTWRFRQLSDVWMVLLHCAACASLPL
jgi:hypothetical protein